MRLLGVHFYAAKSSHITAPAHELESSVMIEMIEPSLGKLLKLLTPAELAKLLEEFGKDKPEELINASRTEIMVRLCPALSGRSDCWAKITDLLTDWAKERQELLPHVNTEAE